MKVLGKRKQNLILEVTPYEYEAIRTALLEWQIVENDTSKPVKKFGIVFDRIDKAMDKFDSLPEYKDNLQLSESKKEIGEKA